MPFPLLAFHTPFLSDRPVVANVNVKNVDPTNEKRVFYLKKIKNT